MKQYYICHYYLAQVSKDLHNTLQNFPSIILINFFIHYLPFSFIRWLCQQFILTFSFLQQAFTINYWQVDAVQFISFDQLFFTNLQLFTQVQIVNWLKDYQPQKLILLEQVLIYLCRKYLWYQSQIILFVQILIQHFSLKYDVHLRLLL